MLGRKAVRRAGEGWAAPTVLAPTAPLSSLLVAPQDTLFLGPSTPFSSPVFGSFWFQATEKVVGVGEIMKSNFRWSTCDLGFVPIPVAPALGWGWGEEIYSDPWPRSMFKASLGHMRPCPQRGAGKGLCEGSLKTVCDASSVVLFEQKPDPSLVPCARSCRLQLEEQGLISCDVCFLTPLPASFCLLSFSPFRYFVIKVHRNLGEHSNSEEGIILLFHTPRVGLPGAPRHMMPRIAMNEAQQCSLT